MELEGLISVISGFEAFFKSGDAYGFLFFTAVGFGLLAYCKAKLKFYVHTAIAVAIIFIFNYQPNQPPNISELRLQKIQEKELTEHETELVEQYSSPKTVEEMRTLKLKAIQDKVAPRTNLGRFFDEHELLGLSVIIGLLTYIMIVFFSVMGEIVTKLKKSTPPERGVPSTVGDRKS